MSKNLNDVFGEASYGTKKTNWIKFPKEGGSLILRILPPYGSLRDSKKWNQYYAVHYGYRDTKGRLRLFQSCEVVNRNTKMVEVADPALEKIKKMKSALEKAKVEGNTAMAARLAEELKVFNLSKKYYMNVMDLNGKVGVFSIGYKQKQALDAVIEKVRAEGRNPAGVTNAPYFVFTRTGFGNQTSHSVSVYQEEVVMNGMKVKVDKISDLTPEIISKIEMEGADLGDMYIAPTPEEIATIVTGGPAALEAVMNKYRKSNYSESGPDESDEEVVSAPAAQTQQQTAAPTAPAATEPAKSEPTPSEAQIATMSSDDLLKSLGF